MAPVFMRAHDLPRAPPPPPAAAPTLAAAALCAPRAALGRLAAPLALMVPRRPWFHTAEPRGP